MPPDIESDPWTIGLGRREGELFRFSFVLPVYRVVLGAVGTRHYLDATLSAARSGSTEMVAGTEWLFGAPHRLDFGAWSAVGRGYPRARGGWPRAEREWILARAAPPAGRDQENVFEASRYRHISRAQLRGRLLIEDQERLSGQS